MKVKVKKLHKDAVIPKYAKPGDAGLDLTAVTVSNEEVHSGGETTYRTIVWFGLAFEIPEGYVGLIFPRSSVHKVGSVLSNCVGVIDSGYRGEVRAVFYDLEQQSEKYKAGDRCAQMIIMPYPQVEFVEADELSSTVRGEGGFGSSGR